MFFETPRFPEVVQRRASIGPSYDTRIVTVLSGHESRNINRERGRIEMEVAKIGLVQDDYATILAWFRVCKGRAHSFRVKDWSDYRTVHAAGNRQGGGVGMHGADAVGSFGVGWGTPAYQISIGYLVGAIREVRGLRKPVVGTIEVKRGGVAVTVGAGAGQMALDTTTGIFTMEADQAQAVTAVTVGATTQVTLDAALAGMAVGGRLWLVGLTGADAALLNDKSHQITNIAGAVYTLATNTAGKTITAAGAGRKYPQPTETLTVACEFDVPMRFDVDRLPATLEAFNVTSYESIPLIEDLTA